MTALVRAVDIAKTFPGSGGWLQPRGGDVRAVDRVSFEIARGQTLGVVGESGCGKSTLGRLLLRLIEPTAGQVIIDGEDVFALAPGALRAFRRKAQMVFQDPFGSLSPRRTVADTIAEPMEVFGLIRSHRERRDRVAEIMTQVGLSPQLMDRYPRQFSGGQRQRIGIARAIAVDPLFIVADEPVSALDVSVQAQIISLLQDLQESRGFSYLFVAHDLAVVRHIADQVLVMYLGRVVELGAKADIYRAPQHPYTQALLSAVPQANPDAKSRRIVLDGDVPSPTDVPSGCGFRTRCPIAAPICSAERPELRSVAPGQSVACHFARPFPLGVEG
jgi:peptide/nickel transport system ATP-binding protein/oligopeptide transport system ATP-binding protein